MNQFDGFAGDELLMHVRVNGQVEPVIRCRLTQNFAIVRELPDGDPEVLGLLPPGETLDFHHDAFRPALRDHCPLGGQVGVQLTKRLNDPSKPRDFSRTSRIAPLIFHGRLLSLVLSYVNLIQVAVRCNRHQQAGV